MRPGLLRGGMLLGGLLAMTGCAAFRWSPGVPSTSGQHPVAFADEPTLRAFLEKSARARPRRAVHRGYITEPEGAVPYEHTEEQLTPELEPAMSPAVEPARGVLRFGDTVWAARERGLARATWRDGTLVTEPSISLPGQPTHFVSTPSAGLLALDGAVAVVMSNDCGGFTLARYTRADGPVDVDGRVRVCGTLVASPWVARVGGEVLAYAVFDVLGENEQRRTLPTVETSRLAARSLLALGPVYYPLQRDSDVLLRAVLRCDATLVSCSAHAWVSPRSGIDALWVDAENLAFAFSARGRSTVHQLPLTGSLPRYVQAPKGAFALAGLSGGRLALLRGDLRKTVPDGRRPFSVELIDDQGRTSRGATLPAAKTGGDGHWTWAFHGDWLVYGPTRTHNFGGADTPRVFVAPLPGGPVEVQPILPSVDTVRFVDGEAVLMGADDKGEKRVVRRPLTRPGPWREAIYEQREGLGGEFGFEKTGFTQVLRLGKRRLLVVPYSDWTWISNYRQRVLELTSDGVTLLGDVRPRVPPESRGPDGDYVSDPRFGAVVWGEGRLLLRLSRELVMVEPTDTGLRELARLPL